MRPSNPEHQKSFRNWIFRRKHLKTRYRRRLRRGSFIVRKSRATINSPPFPCRMAISIGDNSCFRLYISFDDLKMGFADFCILVNHTNSLSIRRISETRHPAFLKISKNLYGSANSDLLAFTTSWSPQSAEAHCSIANRTNS